MFITTLIHSLLIIYIGAGASFVIYKIVTGHYKKTWHKKRLDLPRNQEGQGEG